MIFLTMKILLSYNVNELIKAIHKDARRSSKERSALCKAELIDWNFQVTDLFFPKQKNNSGYTEFTWEPLDELSIYLFEKNGNLDDYGKYCVRLHSHHNMNAFRSGTDVATRKWFKDWWSDWFISIVTSKSKWSSECSGIYYHATLDVFNPVPFDIDLQVELWLPSTVVQEKETESFMEYKAWLKNLRKNYKLIQERYCLTDDQMEWLVNIDVNSYHWQKVQIFYIEPEEIRIDKEKKITDLASVEEVTKTYTYGWGFIPEVKKKANREGKNIADHKNRESRWPWKKEEHRSGYDDRDERYSLLLEK